MFGRRRVEVKSASESDATGGHVFPASAMDVDTTDAMTGMLPRERMCGRESAMTDDLHDTVFRGSPLALDLSLRISGAALADSALSSRTILSRRLLFSIHSS